MVEHFSLETVQATWVMCRTMLKNQSVALCLNRWTYRLDNGSVIQVAIAIDKSTRSARIDFTGTSPLGNFNAPAAVCKATVLYVFHW